MKTAAAALLAAACLVLAATTAQARSSRPCSVSGYVVGQYVSGYVSASYHTSCPFARRVALASERFIIRAGGAGDGDFYTLAYSPVTRRWYRAHCFAHGDIYRSFGIRVDCRAGIGARVVYRAWIR